MRLKELPDPSPFIRKTRTKYLEGKLAEIIRILRTPGSWLDPDTTYIRLLQSCTTMKALPEGKQVHSHMLKHGLKPNNHTWFTLISMYAKCGCFLEAHHVLNSMPQRSRDSWTALIAAHLHQGHGEEALKLFWSMLQENVRPNEATVVCALNACAGLAALEYGKQIHGYIIENGHELDLLVQNSLMKMYCKCNGLQHANRLFASMRERNLASWTAIIAGYADHGRGDEAIKLFWQMLETGVKPNNVAFASALKACANLGAVELGRDIHQHIQESGLGTDVLLNNMLISMYTKCGSIREARQVFDRMSKRDVLSCNEMIAGYSQNGLDKDAFKIFEKMQREVIKPDIVTVTRMMNACINLEDPDRSREVHSYIIKSEFKSNITVLNNVLDMYIKCMAIEEARQVFDALSKRDVATWNTMIMGYVQLGHGEEALKLFQLMQEQGMKPNDITFVSLLNACANLSAFDQGKEIHEHIVKTRYESHIFVSSALIDMYAKCGSIENAFDVFTKLPERDVVSWNTMVAGFAHNGYSEHALHMFWKLQQEGLKPSTVTFACALNACASLGVVEQGKEIHSHVMRKGLENNVFIESALMDMYAKCGSLGNAYEIFSKMQEKDVVLWTAIIVGFARHGHDKEAIKLFEQMLKEGVKPNKATYMGILIACSHTGLVDEGHWYFNSMKVDHDISPSADHFACMVDLFGRAGCLEAAENFVQRIPFQARSETWMSLLGASKIHGDLELAERAARSILKIEPHNISAVVQLSTAHAGAGRWADKIEVRKSING